MNINKNNYEAFFLDYHEGNLSPHQVADLLLFLEQHPELKAEFENFENITLQDIATITFDNKNELKKDAAAATHSRSGEGWDELMIASVEGILTKEEKGLLDQQLSADAKLQHEFLVYQKTKITADVSIVFENKERLKHKEKKVIPLFYYIAAAASLLLLMGLFFVFNNGREQKLAEQKVQSPKFKVQSLVEHPLVAETNKEEKNSVNHNGLAVKNKTSKNKISKNLSDTHNEQTTPPTIYQNGNRQLATNNQQPIADNQQQVTNNQQPTTNNEPVRTDVRPGGQPIVAEAEKKNEETKTPDFLSLREIAATKIKEKTLDKNTIAAQKKSGRFRKFSGWDIAQLVTKGVSKLTGRNVEVKPTYNEQGDVTAYSLGIGEFQVSRGR